MPYDCMMDYASIRQVHITCAAVSISLFAARGAMQQAGIDWRSWRSMRIVPHINDTILLAAAIALAVRSGQYPFVQAWLTAKLVGLIAYVALGSLALRRDASLQVRRVAMAAALLAVGYVVAVALTRSATLGLA